MAFPFSGLARHWRDEADRLRRYGAEAQASAVEQCAAELESEERDYLFEELTVQEAADELGVSYETIGRRVRRGELPNSGEKHKPRVRRVDLMQRVEAFGPRAVTDHGEPDIADRVLRSGT